MVCLSRPYYFRYFKDSLPQILLGPFLNISPHISLNKYLKHTKTATVRPIFKRYHRTKINNNYRPVRLPNIFPKIYELFPHEKTFLSKFISAYRKSYISNHVLISLMENWKKWLDQKKFVGPVLMGL